MTDKCPAELFWEKHYQGVSPHSSGRPSSALTTFVKGRPPGRALELGCARGDDAVWLARRGWQVTAVDISQTALDYARMNAGKSGMEDMIIFARHDLGLSFPAGAFDLVTALFLHSPVDFPGNQVLRQAAAAVAPGGLLLIASHGSVAPWSWSEPGTVFPDAQEILADLDLDMEDWSPLSAEPSRRQATGPGGQTAEVTDIHLVLERERSPAA